MKTHWRQALLVDLCDGKRSAQDIGKLVGLTRDAVISRLQRLAKHGMVTTIGDGMSKRYIAVDVRDPVDMDELLEIDDGPKPPLPQQRACLSCGKVFWSFGPGNRLCEFHRRTASGSDYTAHMPTLRY